MILATETEGLSRLFDLDLQLLADTVLMIIAMFFLFMFASHFLFNPVRKMLSDRQAKIKSELEQAAIDQKSAAETRTKYEEKLRQADKEAEAILADARKRGMENEARIVAEAREEAAKIVERAKVEAELEEFADVKDLAESTQWEITTKPENKVYKKVLIPLYRVDKENGKVWEEYEAARFKANNVKYFLSHRMDWDKMEGLAEVPYKMEQDKSYLQPDSDNYVNLKHANFSKNPAILPDLTGVRAFTPCDAEGNPIEGLVRNYTRLVKSIDKDSQAVLVSLEFVFEDPAEDAAVAGVLYHVQPVDNNRGDFEAMSDRAVDKSIEIPEIDVRMESVPIVAKTRKLKTQWTPEFAQDLNAYHSIDAEAELTSFMSEYISMELDLELLDMLIQSAVTTDHWSAKNNTFWNDDLGVFESEDDLGVSGYYNTQGGWFQTLGTKAQKISNKIHQKTLRGGATFMVTSPTISTILESIPGYAANTDGDKMEYAMGVQKVGSLNSRWQVYKNPYMTENIIFMGYKGSQFLECGAVYAPYIPLMMTPLVYDPETFTPRKGLMTRYAKLVLRPEFYGKLYISGLETI